MVFPKLKRWQVVVAFVVILALVMAWRSRPISNKPQVLPDGTILTLVQVDYGKTNVFYVGNWFQKTFRRWIPDSGLGIGKIRLMPPKELGSYNSKNDELVFWAEGNASLPSMDSSQGIEWLSNKKAIVFNELGDEYPADRGSPGADYGKDVGWDWEITAFPRNGKTVGLRLLEKSGSNVWKTIAEFITRNPTPGPHKTLTAEHMPAVRTNGNMVFELHDLQVGKNTSDVPHKKGMMTTRATIKVFEDGREVDSWWPGSTTMSEGNGNYYETTAIMIGKTNSATIWEFDDALDPQEAWKLTIVFMRFVREREDYVSDSRTKPVYVEFIVEPTMIKTNAAGR